LILRQYRARLEVTGADIDDSSLAVRLHSEYLNREYKTFCFRHPKSRKKLVCIALQVMWSKVWKHEVATVRRTTQINDLEDLRFIEVALK
jgi:hypothetical protein